MTIECRKSTLLCVDDNQAALHLRKLVLEVAVSATDSVRIFC